MSESNGDPLIVLIYNVGDMVGRILYPFLQMKDSDKVSVYGLLRCFLLGGLYFASMQWQGESIWGNMYLSIGLLVVLALSNGHFTTLIFTLSAERVEDRYKGASGFLCVAGVLFGLMYGSGVAYLALNVGV